MFFKYNVYISNNYIILVLNQLCHIGWESLIRSYAIMAQVVMGMLMEGNQILESFAKRGVAYLELLSYLVFRGKILIPLWLKNKRPYTVKSFIKAPFMGSNQGPSD
jgi:hypothetical protein